MNIYLQKNECYLKVGSCWRSKIGIGGCLFFMGNRFSPEIKNFHFTYPIDGDCHFTAELNDGTKFRVFYNRAYQAEPRNRFEITRRESLPKLIEHLGPRYRIGDGSIFSIDF